MTFYSPGISATSFIAVSFMVSSSFTRPLKRKIFNTQTYECFYFSLFSEVAYCYVFILHSHKQHRSDSASFSTYLPAFGVILVSYFIHPDRYAVIIHCGFNFHFHNECLFHMLICHLYTLFGEMLFMSFDHFLTGFFNC